MILVTGVNGQLGFDVVQELNKRGIQNRGIDIKELDITKKAEVLKFISDLKPISVIHCAGYTQVDKAEEIAETTKCFEANHKAAEYIAIACKENGSKMVYMSTDYVFDGTKIGEYEVVDEVNPLSKYGESKVLGEKVVLENLEEHFIIRTSWLFGSNGKNFINTMIRLGKEKEVVDVVCDEIGSPTYTKDLAFFICELISTNKYGIYHATNEGFCSWADLAKKVLEMEKIQCKVNPILANEYKSVAKRPHNSRLSKKCLTSNGFDLFPSWENAVERYLLMKRKGKEE